MGQVVAIEDYLPVRPPGLPETCSDRDLVEAVKAFLCGSSEATLSGLLRVPTHAVRHWTDSREWGVLCQTLRPEVEGVLGGQMTRLASLAFVQLENRLVNGDVAIGADGQILMKDEVDPETGEVTQVAVFKPLKAKELSLIATQMLETRSKIKTEDPKKKDLELGLIELAKALNNYAESKPKDISGESRREA